MQGIAIHQKGPFFSTRKHEPFDILNGGVDICCGGLGYNAWQAPLDLGCFLKVWSYFSPTLCLAVGQNASKEISKSTLWLLVTFVFSSKSLEETELFTDPLAGAFKFMSFASSPQPFPKLLEDSEDSNEPVRPFLTYNTYVFSPKGLGKEKTPPMSVWVSSVDSTTESSESTHCLELLLVQR